MAPTTPDSASHLPAETDFSYKGLTEEEVLEDLTSRFILNLPDDELSSLERICFQVEQAHWYYEDWIREANNKLPCLPLRKFTHLLFTKCPLLAHFDPEEAFKTFMEYKTKVPVCGAIMLNDTWDKCVLVKGWKSSSGWGFPKGKINEIEPRPTCAVREVLEETGYNLAGQVNPDHRIEIVNNGQIVTLFIVPGVPEDFEFRTRTRKEISKIEWFKLTDLPGWKKTKQKDGKFYMIAPFMGQLRNFVNTNKPRKGRNRGGGPRSKDSPPVSDAPPQENDTMQDSSSQASSLDNGEPQTPSPRYTQPTVFSPTIVGEQNNVAMESLDPQLARLLSGLSLSAVSEAPIKPTPTVEVSAQLNPEPAGASVSSTATATPVAGVPATENRGNATKDHRGSPTVLQRSTPIPHITPSASAPPNMPAPNSSQAPKSPTIRKSTADISPYLTRASTAEPLNARRLQQLALLESVASESARQTPAPQINGLYNGVTAVSNTSPFVPANPPRQHTAPHFYPRQPNGTQYGHLPPPPFHDHLSRAMHPPQELLARARTSQGLHRTGMHHPASLSMNQHQLLSLINGNGPNTGSIHASGPQALGAPPHRNNLVHGNHTVHHPGPRMYGTPYTPGLPPMLEHGGPPPQVSPVLHRPRPFSTAPIGAHPPGPGLMLPFQPQNSNERLLLSLLGPAAVPPASTPPAQPIV